MASFDRQAFAQVSGAASQLGGLAAGLLERRQAPGRQFVGAVLALRSWCTLVAQNDPAPRGLPWGEFTFRVLYDQAVVENPETALQEKDEAARLALEALVSVGDRVSGGIGREPRADADDEALRRRLDDVRDLLADVAVALRAAASSASRSPISGLLAERHYWMSASSPTALPEPDQSAEMISEPARGQAPESASTLEAGAGEAAETEPGAAVDSTGERVEDPIEPFRPASTEEHSATPAADYVSDSTGGMDSEPSADAALEPTADVLWDAAGAQSSESTPVDAQEPAGGFAVDAADKPDQDDARNVAPEPALETTSSTSGEAEPDPSLDGADSSAAGPVPDSAGESEPVRTFDEREAATLDLALKAAEELAPEQAGASDAEPAPPDSAGDNAPDSSDGPEPEPAVDAAARSTVEAVFGSGWAFAPDPDPDPAPEAEANSGALHDGVEEPARLSAATEPKASASDSFDFVEPNEWTDLLGGFSFGQAEQSGQQDEASAKSSQDQDFEEQSLAAIRGLYRDVARHHCEPLPSMVHLVAKGTATPETVEGILAILSYLRDSAREVEHFELAEALKPTMELLEGASASAETWLADYQAQREFLQDYARLAALEPEIFAPLSDDLDGWMVAESTIVVEELRAVSGLGKTRLGKLYAAGVGRLATLCSASSKDIEAVTGIKFAIACRIVRAFEPYRALIEDDPEAQAQFRGQVRAMLESAIEELRDCEERLREEAEKNRFLVFVDDREKKLRKARERLFGTIRKELAILGHVQAVEQMAGMKYERRLEVLGELMGSILPEA